MWTPWRAAREEREFRAATLQAMKEMSVAQSEAIKEMALSVRAYLDSFKTDGPPRSWTNDDRSEALIEHERLLNDPTSLPSDWRSNDLQRLQFMMHDLDG